MESMVSDPPAARGIGLLGQSRTTMRSVARSGVNRVLDEPVARRAAASILSWTVYTGRVGDGSARGGRAGHPAAAGAVVGRGAVVAAVVDVDGAVVVAAIVVVGTALAGGGSAEGAERCDEPPHAGAATSTSASATVHRGRARTTVHRRSRLRAMAATLTPTCVWVATPELIVRLDGTFGEPLDTYVNGSQVWLRPEGPDELTIEWRLHPVASYQRPRGVTTETVFERTALALATGEEPPAPLSRLWDGLEAFPAYGDEAEPQDVAALCAASLGISPDAVGLADHQRIADEWERTGGAISIVDELLRELSG
jgi:hypothetical protein